jgi:hypothetical protein
LTIESTNQKNRRLRPQIRQPAHAVSPGKKIPPLNREIVIPAQVFEIVNRKKMDIR